MSIFASLAAPDDADRGDDDAAVPLIYQGSHVLPEADDPRGGSIDIALIPAHVRYYRDNPDGQEEPWLPPEPFLRLGVNGRTLTGDHDDTVILDRAGVQLVHDTLAHWLEQVTAA